MTTPAPAPRPDPLQVAADEALAAFDQWVEHVRPLTTRHEAGSIPTPEGDPHP